MTKKKTDYAGVIAWIEDFAEATMTAKEKLEVADLLHDHVKSYAEVIRLDERAQVATEVLAGTGMRVAARIRHPKD